MKTNLSVAFFCQSVRGNKQQRFWWNTAGAENHQLN